MKKYTLQEESSRIKNMMGINEDLQSPMDEKSIGSVSDHSEESDLNEADWNSPEERERIRMYNETSNGATMVLQSIDKLFDSINREAYHRCRRAIEGVLKELHYEVNNPQESSVENDDYPGIRISDIKQDERQERNYGVEDN